MLNCNFRHIVMASLHITIFLNFLNVKKIQFQTSSSQVNFCYFQGYIVIDSAEPAAINCNICIVGKENNMLVVKEFDSKELIFRIVA